MCKFLQSDLASSSWLSLACQLLVPSWALLVTMLLLTAVAGVCAALVLLAVVVGWWFVHSVRRDTVRRGYQEFLDGKTEMGALRWQKGHESRAVAKKIARHTPPPYPNGWYCLCFSEELPAGQVRYVHALGMDIVVFRGRRRKACAMEAYCSHLGANLAVEGEIVGEDCLLRCPFHGWEFDGETGECVRIPYAGKASAASIPKQAHLESFVVSEQDGRILMWFHATKERRQHPDYPAPALRREEELRARKQAGLGPPAKLHLFGRSFHSVACHIAEIPENGADIAHLNCLHKEFVFPWLSALSHTWEASWQPDSDISNCDTHDTSVGGAGDADTDSDAVADGASPTRRHQSRLCIKEKVCLWGMEIPGSEVIARGNQIGPGSIVVLHFDIPFFGEIFLSETVLPLKPLLQKVTHTLHSTFWVPSIISAFFLYAAVYQFEKDVPLWSNKIYRQQPTIIAEDRAILRFRQWYKQFYCDDSMSMEDALAQEQENREW